MTAWAGKLRVVGRAQALRTGFDLALLALIVWLAHFSRSAEFGLYEDDYTLVSTGMASSWHGVAEFEEGLFSSFGGQGRPLQHGLVFLLSFVAGRLGGLRMAYVIAFAIEAGTAMLFYSLLRRLHTPTWAFLCALSFAAFPADTTQGFLFHAFGLYQCLIWLLLAFHAHLSNRRWLAQGLALGSLLSYETAYPIFLVAPLLDLAWDRQRTPRNMLRHGLVMAAVFLAVVALRYAVGEERVGDLHFRQLLTVPATHMVQGPLVTLGTYVYRPVQAVGDWPAVDTLQILVLTAVLGVSLCARLAISHAKPALGTDGSGVGQDWIEFLKSNTRLIRLLAIGFAALSLAYPLTFTIRAYALSGRATRVHLSAVIGASLVFGSVVYLFLMASKSTRARRLAALALSAYIALLVAFGQVVQADHVRSWALQRAFWTELVALVPDLDDGEVVLVDPTGLQDTLHIDANTWNLPRVLGQIYSFPENWDDPPRVYRLLPDWSEKIVAGTGQFAINLAGSGPPFHGTVASSRVILIASAHGFLERLEGPLEIGGARFQLHPAAHPPLSPIPRGPLFDVLVDGAQDDADGS